MTYELFPANIQEFRKKCEEAVLFCENTAQAYHNFAKGFQLMANCLKLAEGNPLLTLNPIAFSGAEKLMEKWKEYWNNLSGQQKQDKSDYFSDALVRLWF